MSDNAAACGEGPVLGFNIPVYRAGIARGRLQELASLPAASSSSTPLTLVALPALYRLVHARDAYEANATDGK